jgi:hypothetical protein
LTRDDLDGVTSEMLTDNAQKAAAALAPLADALQADGYVLTVAQVPPDLELTVTATADACAECLVPKAMFREMAAATLKDSGVAVTGDIRIIYPEAHHES